MADSHHHLLQVSRVPPSKPGSSFPDKCFLEPWEGLIFSTLLRDATENDCVLLQREEESDISLIAGMSYTASPQNGGASLTREAQ